MAARPVTDDPVRGVIAPPWVNSLPGIDRLKLLAQGLIPAQPFVRLCGIRIGHVSSGSATGTMKAGSHTAFVPGNNLAPLYVLSCWGAAVTAVGPGLDLEPLTVSTQYFRNPRSQPGSFIGRARIANTSSRFVSSVVEIDDPVGRVLGHSISQWAIKALDPPPPSAPPSLEPVEEAAYPTPDPPDRPTAGFLPGPDLWSRHSGLELARMYVAGDLEPPPVFYTFGATWDAVDEGSAQVSMPASEWFCSMSRTISPAAIESLLNMATTTTSSTIWGPGQAVVFLEVNSGFLRPVVPDGRRLIARGKISHRVGNFLMTEAEALDADGRVVATQSASFALLDPKDRRPSEPERVLATLLFTDIVGSTTTAERMGDAAWRQLLGEHNGIVRRQLGAHRGREVKTTGDGFLARFESPAAAIRCALAIRDEVRHHRLEVRIGVHTGECEVQGTDLTGIAVHVAARIMSLAGAGEIFVSQTVRDLASGSGLRFEERGLYELKGMEGKTNVFAVTN